MLQACRTCEHIADFADGGHGALLSPLPPGFTGLIGDLLNDPPGFDRAQVGAVDRKITAFFIEHLPSPRPEPAAASFDAFRPDVAAGPKSLALEPAP